MSNSAVKSSPALAGKTPVAIILAVSALAVAFLFWLIYFKDGVPRAADQTSVLPPLNASLNALSALSIIGGIVSIKSGQHRRHGAFMLAAFGFSATFLLCYIVYYWLHGNTEFQSQGPVRIAYFSILMSHIALSVVALPMVLTTFFFALTKQFDRHPKLARWTYPVWLYVSVTGVLVFLLVKYVG